MAEAAVMLDTGPTAIKGLLQRARAALAQQRGIPVETALAETMPGLVTTWLYDPDQVTNYFAEIRPRQGRGAGPAAAPAPAPAR